MTFLFLYNNDVALPLKDFLLENGHEVICFQQPIDNLKELGDFDYVISYSYRYLISEKIIEEANGKIINLHISYLPWNRGANPNQWSWIENTPKGVTIHFLSSGLDKGDIIAQRLVDFGSAETFRTSYQRLNEEIVDLFKQIFPYITIWEEMAKKPIGKGSYHSVADFAPYKEKLLTLDMCISDFIKAIR